MGILTILSSEKDINSLWKWSTHIFPFINKLLKSFILHSVFESTSSIFHLQNFFI